MYLRPVIKGTVTATHPVFDEIDGDRKYLNDIVELNHRFIKRRTRPILGFKAFASAAATLDGIEVTHMIRKGQLTPGICPFRQFAELAA